MCVQKENTRDLMLYPDAHISQLVGKAILDPSGVDVFLAHQIASGQYRSNKNCTRAE